MVKVSTELSGLDLCFQVAIRCRKDPHIHGYFSAATKTIISDSIQHTQQLSLYFRVQFANFVEKQGAMVREFKKTRLGRFGAAECALFIAKEFAFDEVFRQGSAINVNKWLATA